MSFEMAKKRALARLHTQGADDDIADLLMLLNSYDTYYTTSSCSGRIILLSIPAIGAKREAEFVGKWHFAVDKSAILDAIAGWSACNCGGELWLMAQSPILHVSCADIECAKLLLSLAITAGFKYSGIKSISNRRVMVEIMSTERMDIPIGKEGVVFCTDQYLEFIVAKANSMLARGKTKLSRLHSLLVSLCQ